MAVQRITTVDDLRCLLAPLDGTLLIKLEVDGFVGPKALDYDTFNARCNRAAVTDHHVILKGA